MSNETAPTKPLSTRLRCALVWGWVFFGATLVGVAALGLLSARSSFTTCSPPACEANHGGDAASLVALSLYVLEVAVTIVLLIFSVRSLRKNRVDVAIAKAARRVLTSSIVQLSILSAPLIAFSVLLLVSFLR